MDFALPKAVRPPGHRTARGRPQRGVGRRARIWYCHCCRSVAALAAPSYPGNIVAPLTFNR
jgi:hypothetical protein